MPAMDNRRVVLKAYKSYVTHSSYDPDWRLQVMPDAALKEKCLKQPSSLEGDAVDMAPTSDAARFRVTVFTPVDKDGNVGEQTLAVSDAAGLMQMYRSQSRYTLTGSDVAGAYVKLQVYPSLLADGVVLAVKDRKDPKYRLCAKPLTVATSGHSIDEVAPTADMDENPAACAFNLSTPADCGGKEALKAFVWIGKATACGVTPDNCSNYYTYKRAVAIAKCGDGNCCWGGYKVLCEK